MSDVAKYGRRNVPKMIKQIDDLRKAISAEAAPAIQAAWDAVEEHIDYAYRRADLTPVVKPLVWIYGTASTPFGSVYGCCPFDRGGKTVWRWDHADRADDLFPIEGDDFESAELAQAAAQADYTARILAALVQPVTQPHNYPARYPDTPEAQRPFGDPLAQSVKGTP